MGHAGITVGEDGATHQANEDIALMRVIPGMSVVVPADGIEAASMGPREVLCIPVEHPGYNPIRRAGTRPRNQSARSDWPHRRSHAARFSLSRCRTLLFLLRQLCVPGRYPVGWPAEEPVSEGRPIRTPPLHGTRGRG